MSIVRVILMIIFPPIAVLDCGLGAIVVTTILSFAVPWVGGWIAAFYFVNRKENRKQQKELLKALKNSQRS